MLASRFESGLTGRGLILKYPSVSFLINNHQIQLPGGCCVSLRVAMRIDASRVLQVQPMFVMINLFAKLINLSMGETVCSCCYTCCFSNLMTVTSGVFLSEEGSYTALAPAHVGPLHGVEGY